MKRLGLSKNVTIQKLSKAVGTSGWSNEIDAYYFPLYFTSNFDRINFDRINLIRNVILRGLVSHIRGAVK